MTPQETLSRPLTLPCGVTIPNRLAKAAVTEGLADGSNRANDRFAQLYRRWGAGGAGLLITGNVHIDRRHLERGGNLAIEGPQDNAARAALADMASAAKHNGSLIMMQINHAGRQTQKIINTTPKAPSAVGLKLSGGRFGLPVAMTEQDITSAMDAFIHAARVAHDTGFDGVQIHAAHGYLISQFLSPLSNHRTDTFGGDLAGRARFLLDVLRGIRAACPAPFILSVKLNSADFQKGGFSEDDSLQVAKWLESEGCDLLEISGGNYEQPRMFDFDRLDPKAASATKIRASTVRREAYFIDFVPRLRAAVNIPLMVTGGFRSADAMASAIADDGIDLIGLARPLVLHSDGARALLDGTRDRLDADEDHIRLGPGPLGPTSRFGVLRDLNGWAVVGTWFDHIYRLADGLMPNTNLSPFTALLRYDKTEKQAARAVRRDLIQGD